MKPFMLTAITMPVEVGQSMPAVKYQRSEINIPDYSPDLMKEMVIIFHLQPDEIKTAWKLVFKFIAFWKDTPYNNENLNPYPGPGYPELNQEGNQPEEYGEEDEKL